jgi:hypothetical protein
MENSLSPGAGFLIVQRLKGGQRTSLEFDIVRNEVDVVLRFKAGVPRLFQDQVAFACRQVRSVYGVSMSSPIADT